MSNPSLLSLRDIPAENLVETYASTTTEHFEVARQMERPSIVVIPACNEENDLPAALLSLSRSIQPVVPIIVENGSSAKDRTYEYATRMGAIVLQCEPAKMRATQVGIRFARERFPEQSVIHFGDADNLYPRMCISALARAAKGANERNNQNGALVFGLGWYDHGPNTVVDMMRSGRIIRKAISRKISGNTPMPYGFNYAVHIDKDERLVEEVCSIDPLMFVREESEICKAATAAGATISQPLSPTAYVFTRGDLIKTRAEWRDFKGASMDTKTKYYKRSYPTIDFKPNSNGREKKS